MNLGENRPLRRLAVAAMTLEIILGVGALGGGIIWLISEIAIVGYSNRPPLQALYLGLGAVMVLVAIAWIRQTGSMARPAKDS